MDNQNLGDIIRNGNTPTNNTGMPNTDPMAAIRQATGLDLNVEDFKTQVNEQMNPTPTATPRVTGGIGVLTPEEAAQLKSDGNYQKIDVDHEAMVEQEKKRIQREQQQQSDMNGLLDEALSGEAARNQKWEKAFEENPELKKEFVNKEDASDTTKYTPDMVDNDAHVAPVERTPIKGYIAEDDMVPSYSAPTESIVDTLKKSDKDTDTKPAADASENEMAEYVKNLTTIEYEGSESEIVDVSRDRTPMITETARPTYKKTNPMGDQAFLNAVAKYKKDNFRVVKAVMINSGFEIGEVGTGPVDLYQLYMTTDQNTTVLDYQLAKMTTVIKNVVSTTPAVDPMQLKNVLHFADYQMLAYAHVAATLKEVEMLHTCNKCGKDFHIKAASTDLILNADEMREKAQRIHNATSIDENSLMTKDVTYTTESGFVIVLGHPSYAEYAAYMRELRDIVSNGDTVVNNRIEEMNEILPFIRKITLPTGVFTSNLFQRFTAIGLLSDDDFNGLSKEVANLAKQIIIPKFGIKKIKCPHCGEVITDIAYDDLDNLLFFHFTVNRLLKSIDQ